MKRTDGDAFVTIVSAASANVNGFGEGNPTVPTNPSQVKADFLNNVQEEIAAVIDAAGITLDGTNFGQLLAALHALFVDVATNDQQVTGRKNFTGNMTLSGGATADFQNGVTLEQRSYLAGDFAHANALANEFSNRALHKAHARVVLNGTSAPAVAAADAYNLHTTTPATCPGGNVLRVQFYEGITGASGNFFASGALPTVSVTLGDELAAAYLPYIAGVTRTHVDIIIRDTSGVSKDPAAGGQSTLSVNVIVEGKQ
jgi:hypothetical protein